MQKIKYHYFFLIFPLLTFISILFSVTNIIRSTLRFDPLKNNFLKSTEYSFVIMSSDEKILSKLSRKFDVNDKKDEIPYLLKSSFISSEDKNFLKHNGIDIMGLSRAFINNIKSGYIKEGGSTITQQLARIIFLNNNLSFQRKIKEILIALIIDFKYSKTQILKTYLNNIYLGSGAYGVNEASQVYFGKLIDELTLSEIALITGLAPAPSIFSPYESKALAIKNRNKVLESMYLDGYISLDDRNKALNEKITLINQKTNSLLNDKILINSILEEVDTKIKNKKKYDFLKINSSINKNWQEKAQKISSNIKPNNIQVALLSIESKTGLIRTLISGRNSSLNEFNRVYSSIRPLGSTFKIIPYAAALIDGIKLNEKFQDVPTCWENYCPKNFFEIYKGEISLIESFKSSSNIVPIKITKKIGPKKIINLANKFGLGYKQRLQEFPSLAIGSFGDSLLNITNAYSAINSDGRLYETSTIEKIESSNGQLIWENKFRSEKILNSEVNHKLTNILEKSVSDGTGIAASVKGKKIFGKTGTTDGNRDLWFIGSIDNLTTGIWIGFDKNKTSNLSSGDAAYLWKSYNSKIKKIN